MITWLAPKDLFDAAQRQMQRNKALSKRNCKNDYLFRGYLVCGKCGDRLRGHITRGWRYYECSGRDTRRRPLAQKCLAKPQNADRLELLVWEEIEKYISDPELIRSAFEHHERNSAQDRGRDDSELEALCRAEQTLKQEESRLLDAYTSGVIELPQLQERTPRP